MAQHGKPELHQKVHQAMERRLVDAGDHPEGKTRTSDLVLLLLLLFNEGLPMQHNSCCSVTGS